MNKRTDTYRHQGMREALCDKLQQQGLTDPLVIAAMRRVPRHWFLDEALDTLAYEDSALPIDCEQTISHPSTVASQSQLLSASPGMKILEIGTGSGYQTSILCEMGTRVYTIERHQPLFVRTKKLLYEMHYTAKCFLGDGYNGLTEIDLRTASQLKSEGAAMVNHNVFDRIIITCGAPYIPEPLMRQLKIGGIMVIPVEDEQAADPNMRLQMLRVVKNGESRDSWDIQRYGAYSFVPMLSGKQF